MTDDRNQLINFNNVNWYMTFQIDIEYLEVPKPGFNNILALSQKNY